MRFLRSLRGVPAGGSGPASGADEEGGSDGRPSDDDAARAAELVEEFESDLSDLARRQVTYAGYAWSPPKQADRGGRWMVTQATEGTAPNGRAMRLRAGDVLELDEDGDETPGRTSWRFFRVKDGRVVDLAAGPGGVWPSGLARPRGSGG